MENFCRLPLSKILNPKEHCYGANFSTFLKQIKSCSQYYLKQNFAFKYQKLIKKYEIWSIENKLWDYPFKSIDFPSLLLTVAKFPISTACLFPQKSSLKQNSQF